MMLPTFESDSHRLGYALVIMEAMLRAVGRASSVEGLRDVEAMKKARAFLQAELSR